MKAKDVQAHLRSLSSYKGAQQSLRFFKNTKGDYAKGNPFLGIRVPVLRAETKRHVDMPIVEIGKLLKSLYHEERLFALLLLVLQLSKADEAKQKIIYDFYMNNLGYINNWDLVDCSAYKIVGKFLSDKNRKPLYDLAKSTNLWERRIAIVSTLYFIKESDYSDTLKLSKILLQDTEDLVQKAVGWMLREVGNRDRSVEEGFLQDHYHDMPRTMLRYSIEKFPETMRQRYLKGLV